ncbi:hypothetical protein SUGI_1114020 [Cryptomeria japonica]|uniref:kxDL motif-containing protein LO9-177 n=1 Tax=Cryptomeria japonica TaxID=3369 RepID=UPI002414A183|nr:kxDL motif-containing protein LO9-177 [Cryptomeria japonica]GLJ52367.1 hypothetical protein SUGI_1114020 [Cryptomeria japonica]
MEKMEGEAAMAAASDEASHQIHTLLNKDDINTLKNLQLLILGRLQDSNAVLSHFNVYSENCFADVASDFSKNTRLLKSMKTDLDYIFRKIRSMKARISSQYPNAFKDIPSASIVDQRPNLEERS